MARLVLVDDARVTRRVLAIFATSLGHEVVAEVTSMQEAVATLVRIDADAVLLDVGVSAGGAREAIRRICDARQGVAVIACAALDQLPLLRDALEGGARAGLVRPFVLQQVAATLARVT